MIGALFEAPQPGEHILGAAAAAGLGLELNQLQFPI